MTLNKRENTGNWKTKQQFELCGGLALEKTKGFSWDRPRNDDDDDADDRYTDV